MSLRHANRGEATEVVDVRPTQALQLTKLRFTAELRLGPHGVRYSGGSGLVYGWGLET